MRNDSALDRLFSLLDHFLEYLSSLLSHKRYRATSSTGPSSSPHAMDVLLTGGRYAEVDHLRGVKKYYLSKRQMSTSSATKTSMNTAAITDTYM